jgi:16S rRNA (guanine527-N7)-methyltransferase
MDIVKFWTICSANGIILTPEQIKQFERYHRELLYWNEKVNLISRKDEDNIFERHFLHSLAILKYYKIPPKSRCLDFGTGGGLPGIPLKIACGDINMLLVDSIRKKIKITDMFVQHSEMRNVKAICCRVEELALDSKYLRSFDFIFSRAVAKLDEMIEWVIKLLKPSGTMIFLKGGDLVEEINAAKSKFPGLTIEESKIKLFGADWFEKEDKKILICEF